MSAEWEDNPDWSYEMKMEMQKMRAAKNARGRSAVIGTYARDLIERVGSTFVQAFLGTLIALLPALDHFDRAALWSLFAAGVAAGLSAVKGLYARTRGNANSASLLGAASPGDVEVVAPPAPPSP